MIIFTATPSIFACRPSLARLTVNVHFDAILSSPSHLPNYCVPLVCFLLLSQSFPAVDVLSNSGQLAVSKEQMNVIGVCIGRVN